MLDIPEEVKALFDRDSVRKNFRAVFDSGLIVTNKDIIMDSLSFRESVSSADSITFGTSEASILNFETVGVGNMLGEWFDAWLEIDATTLRADLQETRDDLLFPVYPVPLGRFVVTACQRNHEAMARRKVTAMSRVDDNAAIIDSPLSIILSRPFMAESGCRFETNIAIGAIDAILGFRKEPEEDFTILSTASSHDWYAETDGFSEARYVDGDYSWVVASKPNGIVGATLRVVGPRMELNTIDGSFSQLSDQSVFAFQYSGDPDDYDAPRFAHRLAEHSLSAYPESPELYINKTQGTTVLESVPANIENLTEFYLAFLTSPGATSGIGPRLRVRAGSILYYGPAPNVYPALLPKTSDKSKKSALRYTFSVIYGFAFGNKASTAPVLAVTPEFVAQHPKTSATLLYKDYGSVNGELILKSTESKRTGDYRGYSYYDFSARDVLPPLAMFALELRGVFGCFSRATGEKYMKSLDPEPVARLQRRQYASAWWDEFDLAPIGSISYKLNNEDCVYQFGDGASQYVFQSSETLGKIPLITQQKVQAMLDEHLVPALQNLTFTPAEIDAVGLPHLEAGDCIELEAGDGSIIKTYVLEREMHGTQHLTDKITADGITITEVDV